MHKEITRAEPQRGAGQWNLSGNAEKLLVICSLKSSVTTIRMLGCSFCSGAIEEVGVAH